MLKARDEKCESKGDVPATRRESRRFTWSHVRLQKAAEMVEEYS